VCDLLKNLDLLDLAFDQDLANKLARLMNNNPSITADLSWGRKTTDDGGEETLRAHFLCHVRSTGGATSVAAPI
jgi:hypothetical protein